jgi:hypothetical protein
MVARGPRALRSVAVRSWDGLARDLIRAHGAWRVHSVFASAFNLVSPDGVLLGVVGESAGNGPATLVLATEASVRSLTDGLQPGDSVRLVLNLSGATLWQPEPVVRTLPVGDVMVRLRRAAQLGASLAPSDGLAVLLMDVQFCTGGAPPGLPWGPFIPTAPQPPPPVPSPAAFVTKMARDHLGRMMSAIRRQDWAAVHAPARELSGLGPGLTPSGDDVLAGMALGYRAGHGTMPDPLADALRTAGVGRTTDIAVARVQLAVTGRPDQATHRLLTVLVSGSGDDLEMAVRDVIAYGHSSGADTLVGLIVGVALGLTAPRLDAAT